MAKTLYTWIEKVQPDPETPHYILQQLAISAEPKMTESTQEIEKFYSVINSEADRDKVERILVAGGAKIVRSKDDE